MIEYIPKSLALDIVSRLCTDYSAAYAEISAVRGIEIVKCRECRWGQMDDTGTMHCHKYHTHKWAYGFCDDGESEGDYSGKAIFSS